ncbi:hypothetical protein A3F28_00800 [Candidatus Uhrbacteria bacterium RIFCSPHIGHO2_12_FULL_57_11]|uniref:Uncharacterized protein n=1 Tax=Candidatus Uhrbacteria bacterium RIFCSPHIGHO2_12_FULL_57_11 TaxID=1802398 RepID=A0A1F7UJS0_9BACT|nr:MAG: hypothetical protein A3F28_00800 [Candidatus Uhrbacteria bacterium RIFCSPHIGHO2_12_FULL_57_11]
MLRSLTRQGPEFDFALAAAAYLSPLLRVDSENFNHIQEQAQQAIGVTGMRGPDSTMWWTFAPYLYQSMVAKGVAEEAAFQRLVEWAKTSPKPNERIGLAGLEMFVKEGIRDYGLPKDVNNILHKFTAQEAERIVSTVFGVRDKNESLPNMLEIPKVSDLESGHISYDAARDMTREPAILDKFYSTGSFQRAVQALADVPTEVKKSLMSEQINLPGRLRNHILRLLARPGAEYDFAIALIKYGPEIFTKEQKEQDNIGQVINAEYTDTVMWWTFAPYLYRNLTSKGVTEEDAVHKVLDWVKSSPLYTGPRREIESLHNLAGLEVFNDEKIIKYALAKNPKDISHRFTAQEAERVVRDVFGIKEKTEQNQAQAGMTPSTVRRS